MDALIALNRDFEVSYTKNTPDDLPWEVVIWSKETDENDSSPYNTYLKIQAMGNGNTFDAALADAMSEIEG